MRLDWTVNLRLSNEKDIPSTIPVHRTIQRIHLQLKVRTECVDVEALNIIVDSRWIGKELSFEENAGHRRARIHVDEIRWLFTTRVVRACQYNDHLPRRLVKDRN